MTIYLSDEKEITFRIANLSIADGYEEKHQEIAPGIFVELDKKGKLMGIEILNASGNIGKFFRGKPSRGSIATS